MPKPPKPTELEKFENKPGVERVDIATGELESESFALDPEEIAHVFQTFDAGSGARLKGRKKPHAKVLEDEAAGTAKIALSAPAKLDLAILYRVEPEEFGDDEEEELPL